MANAPRNMAGSRQAGQSLVAESVCLLRERNKPAAAPFPDHAGPNSAGRAERRRAVQEHVFAPIWTSWLTNEIVRQTKSNEGARRIAGSCVIEFAKCVRGNPGDVSKRQFSRVFALIVICLNILVITVPFAIEALRSVGISRYDLPASLNISRDGSLPEMFNYGQAALCAPVSVRHLASNQRAYVSCLVPDF